MMLTLSNVPLAVYNRALQLYGLEREEIISDAIKRLHWAEGSKDYSPNCGLLSAFAQAVAEYMCDDGYLIS